MYASKFFIARITRHNVVPTKAVRKSTITVRTFKSHFKPLSLTAVYFVFFHCKTINKAMIPNLFTPAQLMNPPGGEYGPSLVKMTQTVQKGSLITFRYILSKPYHDPYPLVLVTDMSFATKGRVDIRGVNLHYSSFNDMRLLLQSNCNNQNFSYSTLKQGQYIPLISAFRQYKRMGIRQVKVLDCSLLLNVLASVRSIKPSEVEAIRNSVHEQISRITNPAAVATK